MMLEGILLTLQLRSLLPSIRATNRGCVHCRAGCESCKNLM